MVNSKTILASSRIIFGAFIVLACLSPSWQEGLFARLPLYHLHIAETPFAIGFLFTLPSIGWALWGVAWLNVTSRPVWRWGRWPIAVPVLGFGMLALLRSWPVHLPRTAVIVIAGIALFWMVYAYTLEAGSAYWVVTLLSIVILLQGAIAVIQFLTQRSLGLAWMGELVLDPDTRGVSVVEAAGHRWLRAYGLTSHPNVLGGYLGVGILVCLGALFNASPSRRWWLSSCALVGGMGLFCTFSRSAWLGTTAGLVYGLVATRLWRRVNWRAPKTRRALFGAGLIALVGVLLLGLTYGNLIWTRLLASGSELEANSLHERLRDMQQAWGLIRQVPLKGVGTGYYVAALWAGAGNDRPPAFQHVHNIPLLAAAEMGIVGALLWLWLTGGPPLEFALTRKIRRTEASTQEGLYTGIAGCASAFVCMMVVSLFDHYLYFPMTWWPAIYIGMLAGVWAGPLGEKATLRR